MVERLLATRKRVLVLFPTEAVLDLILLFLFPNVFLYGCSIDPYCTYVLSRCPEIPVSVLVLQVRVPLEDHHRTLSLEISHDLRDTVFRRHAHQQVDVVRHHMSFYDFDPFPFAQIPDDLLDIFS